MTGRATKACRCAALAVMLAAAVGAVDHPAAAAPANARMQQTILHRAPTTVPDTLRALDRLHAYGYTIDTPARADRAIRHWQRVNGLVVDGIVGPQTIASLGLGAGDATATHPAVRDNLPSGATVEQIIRFVWPDDTEDRAVRIATRESRLVPTARNACCYGLFQINYAVHRSWLADIGVTSPAQLLDPGTNARAALTLYDRAGWQPWAL